MREQASSTLKSLATIVSGDLTEAVASTTVASWRETLAMILTYAREEEFMTWAVCCVWDWERARITACARTCP